MYQINEFNVFKINKLYIYFFIYEITEKIYLYVHTLLKIGRKALYAFLLEIIFVCAGACAEGEGEIKTAHKGTG